MRRDATDGETALANPKLGTKRGCPSCGARFYDLNKSPAECPECETLFNPEDLIRGRRAKTGVPEEVEEKRKPAHLEDEEETDELADVEDVETDDDDDDDLIEDTSDLGDDDDMSGVIDKPERADGDD